MDEVDADASRNKLQADETKSLVQNATESLARVLGQTEESLILWLGLIGIIALASAGLWIGVGGVALVVGWVWFRSRLAWKGWFRVDRFRERFRELLEKASSSEMLDEDKQFLQERADTILYPMAVADHKRLRLSPNDLEHVETLYREYGHVGLRRHLLVFKEEEHLGKCELCAAALRVRRHIEDVFSRIGLPTERGANGVLTTLRRIVMRRNPEVVFRELGAVLSLPSEQSRMEAKRKFKQELERLKNCGFDIEMLYEEMRAAKKRMAKERSETEKVFEKEVVTAQVLDLAEELVRYKRYKEWDKVREEVVAHALTDLGVTGQRQ